jgi:hypothetical protein
MLPLPQVTFVTSVHLLTLIFSHIRYTDGAFLSHSLYQSQPLLVPNPGSLELSYTDLSLIRAPLIMQRDARALKIPN